MEEMKEFQFNSHNYKIPSAEIISSDFTNGFSYLQILGENGNYNIILSDKNNRTNETGHNAPTIAHINDGFGRSTEIIEGTNPIVVCKKNDKGTAFSCGFIIEKYTSKWAVIFSKNQLQNLSEIENLADKQISNYGRS